jgi:hypothetical protein
VALARTEFNTWYNRGLCRKLMERARPIVRSTVPPGRCPRGRVRELPEHGTGDQVPVQRPPHQVLADSPTTVRSPFPAGRNAATR